MFGFRSSVCHTIGAPRGTCNVPRLSISIFLTVSHYWTTYLSFDFPFYAIATHSMANMEKDCSNDMRLITSAGATVMAILALQSHLLLELVVIYISLTSEND
jgi:hypothetical protein